MEMHIYRGIRIKMINLRAIQLQTRNKVVLASIKILFFLFIAKRESSID